LEHCRPEHIEVKHLHDALFPDKPLHPKAIHTLTGELYGLLKRFWAHQALEAQPHLRDTLALDEMRQRQLGRQFVAEAKRIQKNLDQQTSQHPEQYYVRYLLADACDMWYGQQSVRRFDPALQTKMDALDTFYFGTKFANSAEALSRNQILNTRYTIPFLEQLCQAYDQHAAHFPPTVKVYRELLRCLDAPEDRRYFDSFSELLHTHAASFPATEARALFKTAQNYCIRRINLGETAFQVELFTLYRSLLDKQLIFDEKGDLTHTNFKNIVTVGLRQEAFDWVSDFMERYGDYVEEKYRANVRDYCMALYYAEQGEPARAIRSLAGVQFTDAL
jgi:hypothetical protein